MAVHKRGRSPRLMADNPALADVVERNICTLLEVRRKEDQDRGIQEKFADGITAFSGSMAFLYVHVGWFVAWIAVNMRWLGIRPFDPYPFGLLTMVVSLEAIFLSTFVLISQNRMQAAADERADLDLQINLLSEHEVTRLIKLVSAIAQKMGIEEAQDPEVEELMQDTAPETVIEEMQRRAAEE